MAKNIFALGFVFILSIIAVLPLLHPGLHPTHDGEYHVIRFYEFDKVLWEGSIYPRWAPDLNNRYGVPLFNYVYPLPNYAASLLHVLGFSFINSFKLEMFLASIMGSTFFYLWTRRYWGQIGGVVSSVFYAYSPYRFVDIYVRGSVGEVWAISLLPALLYTTDVFFEKRTRSFLVFSAILLALIIFSHNILGLLFFIFYVTYVAYRTYVNCNRKTWIGNLRSLLFILLLGLGLSAIFWLPAILEEKYVTGLQIYSIAENFPQLYQLIIPSWGTGFFNASELGNQMSVQIGIANMLGVAFGIFTFRKLSQLKTFMSFLRKRESRFPIKSGMTIIKDAELGSKKILFFLVWFFISCFLMLNISSIVWKLVPFMQYFQFPWRLLSIVVIVVPFLAGSIFLVVRRKVITGVILVVMAVGLSIGYTKPAYYHDRTDTHYVTRDNFIHGTNSPGNLFNTIWMKKEPPITKEKVSILQGKATITILEEKSTKLGFSVNVLERANIAVSRAYFPGWNVYIDRQKIKANASELGLVSFFCPTGNHSLEIRFEDTLPRKVAAIISTISFVIILAFLGRNRYRIS